MRFTNIYIKWLLDFEISELSFNKAINFIALELSTPKNIIIILNIEIKLNAIAKTANIPYFQQYN